MSPIVHLHPWAWSFWRMKKGGEKGESCYLDGRLINGWQHPAQHTISWQRLSGFKDDSGYFVRALMRDLFDLFGVICAVYNREGIFRLDLRFDSNAAAKPFLSSVRDLVYFARYLFRLVLCLAWSFSRVTLLRN